MSVEDIVSLKASHCQLMSFCIIVFFWEIFKIFIWLKLRLKSLELM